MGSVGELIVPRRCAGCDLPGTLLCSSCRVALAAPPYRISPAVSPMVPVFALGPYADPHRSVILAMKERNNMAVRAHVGAVVAAALKHLEARGELPPDVALVPAPTRPRSARARGGDPVEGFCRHSGYPVAPILKLKDSAPDQAGLGAAARRRNISGNLTITGVPRRPCVVVDDVATTGATLESSVATLLAHGANVAACVVLAQA